MYKTSRLRMKSIDTIIERIIADQEKSPTSNGNSFGETGNKSPGTHLGYDTDRAHGVNIERRSPLIVSNSFLISFSRKFKNYRGF